MAGYYGYSKSNNAVLAEKQGKYPLSLAKRLVAQHTGWSQKDSAVVLKYNHDGEYHHSSKFYNYVKYYNVSVLFDAYKAMQEAGSELTPVSIANALNEDVGNYDYPEQNLERAKEHLEEIRNGLKLHTWEFIVSVADNK